MTPLDFEDGHGFLNVFQYVTFLVAGPMKLVATKNIPPMREIVCVYDILSEDVPDPPRLTKTQEKLVAALTWEDSESEEEKGQSALEEKENMPPHLDPDHEEGVGPGEPKVARHTEPEENEDSMSDDEAVSKKLKKGQHVITTEEDFSASANIICQHYPTCSFPGTLHSIVISLGSETNV